MSKRQLVIIACAGVFSFLVAMSLLAAGNSLAVSDNQPLPVRAPAPFHAPAQAAPVAANQIEQSPVQTNPQPRPIPLPPGVVTVAAKQTSPFIELLPLLLFASTVVLVMGIVVLLNNRRADSDRLSHQPVLARGVRR